MQMHGSVIDLTGKIFGELDVLEYVGSSARGDSLWLCLCECGKKCTVRGSNLRERRTRSCGCFAREVAAVTARRNGRSGMTFGYAR